MKYGREAIPAMEANDRDQAAPVEWATRVADELDALFREKNLLASGESVRDSALQETVGDRQDALMDGVRPNQTVAESFEPERNDMQRIGVSTIPSSVSQRGFDADAQGARQAAVGVCMPDPGAKSGSALLSHIFAVVDLGEPIAALDRMSARPRHGAEHAFDPLQVRERGDDSAASIEQDADDEYRRQLALIIDRLNTLETALAMLGLKVS
jgi:hypothetical protein